MSVAFLPSLVYLPFITPLSLLFFCLFCTEAVFRSCEVKVHMRNLAQTIDTLFDKSSLI